MLVISRIKARLGLDACEVFAYGAAPLKLSTRDFFCGIDMVLVNMYGMSETSGGATVQLREEFKLDTAGFALPGTDLVIDKPDADGEGEIWMRGRHQMMGYFKQDQATMDTFSSDGFIKSGDKGMLDEDGFLRITGRIKELIITAGGENIAPVKIEDTFKEEFPPCSNIMVIGDD